MAPFSGRYCPYFPLFHLNSERIYWQNPYHGRGNNFERDIRPNSKVGKVERAYLLIRFFRVSDFRRPHFSRHSSRRLYTGSEPAYLNGFWYGLSLEFLHTKKWRPVGGALQPNWSCRITSFSASYGVIFYTYTLLRMGSRFMGR